jgi:dihydroneopterin aldolase/2-amino-4-hydroxy-6-hydroxymethyldihydropteridine diphosphokinase/dihydropteroate synthase
MEPDTITLTNLAVHLPLGAGPSAFGLTPPPPCPLELTVTLSLHAAVVPASVDADDMGHLGVNYSSVSKAIYAVLAAHTTWPHPAAVLDAAASVLALPAVQAANVRGRFGRGVLRGDAVVYERVYTCPSPPLGTAARHSGAAAPLAPGPLGCTLENLALATIIGLHPHERAEKQRLGVDVAVAGVPDTWAHKAVADAALEVSPAVYRTR